MEFLLIGIILLVLSRIFSEKTNGCKVRSKTYHRIAACGPLPKQQYIIDQSGSFLSEALNNGVMDGSFLKRVLSEWFRDRKKEQAHAETVSL